MGIYERLNRAPAEGPREAPPAGGIRRFLFLLTTHFWKFVGVNLLFVACSLPIITLPASLCALNRVCIKLIREGNCFLWQDFRDEWRASFTKSLPLGLLFCGLLFLSYYALSLGVSNGPSLYGMLFSAFGLLLAAAVALLGSWTFALVAMLPLGNRDILKNARALLLLEGGRDLAILGVTLAFSAIAFLLFPLSLLLVLLLLPALMQFSICSLVYPAVQNRIVAPYEARRTGAEK